MNGVFIVGCPRSGTTLIQMLLGSHKDIYTCRETHFFQRIRRIGKKKLLDHLFLDRRRVMSAYAFIKARNELLLQHEPDRVRTFGSAAHFLERLMSSEATARGKSEWVEKTPAHLFYVPLIGRHIPSAQFVHILRDGRDVVASLTDAAQRYPNVPAWRRYRELDYTIAEYNRYLHESVKYLGQDRHLFVGYEQILDNADRVCHQLLVRLELPDQDLGSMLKETHTSVVHNDEPWKNQPDERIRDTRLTKYELLFDANQKRRILGRLAVLSAEQQNQLL